MQLAASALHKGVGVIWVGQYLCPPPLVYLAGFLPDHAGAQPRQHDAKHEIDASHTLPGPRFSQILSFFKPLSHTTDTIPSSPPLERTSSELVEHFTHYSTPSLSHLIALLCNQTPNHPDPRTGLIIIDSFSTLISNAFPRISNTDSTPRKPGGMLPFVCIIRKYLTCPQLPTLGRANFRSFNSSSILFTN